MIQPAVEEELTIVARVVEVPVRRQQECRQRAGQERRSVLARVVGRGEEEGLVINNRPAKGAGVLVQLIRNVHRVDRGERAWWDATRRGLGAKVLYPKRLRLPAATGTEQKQSFAMKFVSAGLGGDVQRGTGSPTELGRERVREHVNFLDSAHRHGGNRRLATPALIVVRAVERERGGTT